MKKNTVRILALVLVALMCLSLIPLAAHAEAHVHEMATDHQDPTCVDNGFDQTYCPICNTTFSMDYIPATGVHSFIPVEDEEYLIEEGDCTHPYQYWKSCSVCKQSAEEAYGLAVEQLVEELTARKQSGEQADWETVAKDRIVLLDERYKFSAGGEGHHILHVDHQEATRTSDGWKEYTWCDVCGERFNFEAIPAKGHRWNEFKVTKEATCTEDGSRERVCEVCDQKEIQVIPALGHTWTAFKVTKAATCTEDGSQERTCTVCGEKEIQVIPAAHKFGEFVVIEEPTCFATGTKEHTCTVCGYKETESIPAAHKWGEFVVTQEPTCYSTGEKQRVCALCGETESEWIDMAHKYENGVCVYCGEAQPEGAAQSVSEPAQAEETAANQTGEAAEEPAGETTEPAEEAAEEPAGEAAEEPAEETAVPEDAIYISFDGNGAASGSMEAQAFEPGTSQNLSLNAFVRPGYRFVGWDYMADGSGMGAEPFLDGEEVTLNADITLYAQWAEDPEAESVFATVSISEVEALNDAAKVGELSISEIEGFNEGDAPFEQPELTFGGIKVTEALVGETLTATVEPSDKSYQYQWIRDTNGVYSYISGATKNTYTLTDSDCTNSVYCSVNEVGHLQPARLSTGVHVRKEAPIPVTIRDANGSESTVKIEVRDNIHPDYPVDVISYPDSISSSFNLNALTEDEIKITVNPDIYHDTYVRYVVKNASTLLIGTAKEEKTYTIGSLSTSDASSYLTIFFDIPVCEASETATMEHDQLLASNPAIKEKFIKTYVEKEGQEKPYPYAYYYVTPHWKTAPTVPLSNSEISVVGGFTFTMNLPAGVSDENFDEYDVRAYHYLEESDSWEQIKYRKVPNEAKIEIENFSNFSPFAVVARPTNKASFVGGEHGTVTNPDITADDKGDLVLPQPVFTAANGWTFAGWKVNDETKQPGNTIHITEDIVVTAVWSKGYTIIFNKNEGTDPIHTYGANVTGEMAQEYVLLNEDGSLVNPDQRLTTVAFSLKNHEFQGWSVTPGTAATVNYTDRKKISEMEARTEDLTLYAVWKRTKVTLSFNGSGATGSMAEQSTSPGASITLNANEFTAPTGQMFAGWDTNASAGTVVYKNNETITMPDVDTILYAVWRDQITIHFFPNSDSGTGTGTMSDQIVPSGIATKLKANAFTAPEGKAFASWNDRQDGTGKTYKNRAEDSWTGDTYLYAQWSDKVTIYYSANGGTPETRKLQPAAQGVEVTIATLEQTGFSRDGYTFLGWDRIPSKKENLDYPAGQENKDTFYEDAVYLYAIWEQTGFIGSVNITGSLSSLDELAFVGETLTANVTGESKFTKFEYKWIRDGDTTNIIGEEKTYVPTAEDFGHILACSVKAVDASPDEDTKMSNSKYVSIDYTERQIINNGQTQKDYIEGLLPTMTYTINGVDQGRVTLVNGLMEVTKQGVYQFFREDGTYAGSVTVVNWWTIGYNISTGTGDSSGNGTVTMKRGSTTLTSSTTIRDSAGNVILQPYSMSGYSNVWIVRQDAGITDITLTVKPSSGSYGHVSVNGGSYDSSSSERVFNLGSINQAMMYDVIFNKSSTSPRTADMSHLGLWSALCLTSFVGAATILGSARKRKKEQD